MSLRELRDYAQRRAERKGHSIKRWNSSRAHRYTAVCMKCRASIAVYSQCVDEPIDLEFEENDATIIARSRSMHWTGLDYNWADGEALERACEA